ncbi:MAG TPA: hypothetical protein VMR34_00695 [Candidatus Saccharimonadales bacterium]|nr:hypothetical protein [Candidatus Saccharimonadales bacterium]
MDDDEDKKSVGLDKIRQYETSPGNRTSATGEAPQGNRTSATGEGSDNQTEGVGSPNFYKPTTGGGEPAIFTSSSEDEDGEGSGTSTSGGLYNSSKAKNALKSKIKKTGSKKTKLLLIGGGGGGGLMVIAILLIFAASLLIPGFEQNIIDWQFARVARSFADDSAEITEEKLAIEAASPEEKAALENEIDSQSDTTLKEIETYNPQTTENALTDSVSNPDEGLLQLDYSPSGQLNGITQDGQADAITDTAKTPAAFAQQEHGAADFTGNPSSAQSAFESDLSTNTDGISTVIRGPINVDEILPSLGIELEAWTPQELADYTKDTPTQAEAELEQDAYKAIDDQAADGSSTVSQDNSDAKAAAADETNCVENAQCLETIVSNDGEEPAVVATDLANDTASSWWNDILGAISPAQAVALPLCIIYDGSIDNSGSTIDAQDAEMEKTGYLVDSAGDQQKAGDTNAQAVGAFNWKLGNIDQSIPEERASGQTIDTTSVLSPQTGASGTYSLFNVVLNSVGLPGWIASSFNSAIKPSCQAITSPEGVITVATVNVLGNAIADVFTGGGATTAEEGAELSVQEVISQIASELSEQLINKDALKDIFTSTFSKETLGKAATIAGATLLSKLIVVSSMGATDSGLSTNAEFADDADAGNNLSANQLEQLQFYGRPLTNSEVAATSSQDTSYLASLNSKKNAYQRYFALSNPSSLTSHVVSTIASIPVKSFFSSMFSKIGDILQPLSWISKLPFVGRANAVASTNIDNQDYGIVQWGWSAPEESLIKTDPSYQPLENQMILDKSGQESSIAGKYASTCYSINKTMGDLLSSGQIQRDSNGDVIPAATGLCSPCNLTTNDPIDTVCPPDNDPGNLVFRWRVAQAYDTTIQQLTDIQNGASPATN